MFQLYNINYGPGRHLLRQNVCRWHRRHLICIHLPVYVWLCWYQYFINIWMTCSNVWVMTIHRFYKFSSFSWTVNSCSWPYNYGEYAMFAVQKLVVTRDIVIFMNEHEGCNIIYILRNIAIHTCKSGGWYSRMLFFNF